MSPTTPARRSAPVGGLVRSRAAHTLEFAVELAPAAVIDRFLAAEEVVERRSDTGHGDDPGYALERIPDGFTLTADPGAWRGGTRAICEVHLTPDDQGAHAVVRFRLHPLTRTALAYIIALGLVMTAFQMVIAGPAIAAALLVPFLVFLGLIAADRSSLRRQQRALRSLVEATLTPIALPHERGRAAPFRRGTAD